MFPTLIYPSSGARHFAVELPHRSFCSRYVLCWRFGAAVFEWCDTTVFEWCDTNVFEWCDTNVFEWCDTAVFEWCDTTVFEWCDTTVFEWCDTAQTHPQHSRKLLMMDVLMFETC